MAMQLHVRTTVLLAAFAALGLPSLTRAEAPAPAASGAPALEPDAASVPASARPKRDRAISDNLAASLAESMPKYNPPKPVEKKPEDDVDLRDVDKPKNHIIRLPKYIVREPKPPVFRERDLYSSASLADLAMRRYAGLNFGPFSDLNKKTALDMYREDERLHNIADMKDAARTASFADPAEGVYLKRVTEETYSRDPLETDRLSRKGDAWADLRAK
jgi:hypothetical protein